MLILFIPLSAEAIADSGTGMLFGADHAFSFTAPNGWVLDNQSGVQQGLHMVFYPAGQTWEGSPVMAYGMSVAKNSELRSIEDQVKRTIEDFQSDGSNNYRAESKDDIQLPGGKIVKVYWFSGDQWGNYEAAGYIEEKDTINFIVYNSRNKVDFENNLSSFKAILMTYKNLYVPKNIEKDKATFDQLISEAKTFENTKEGAEYVKVFFNSYGSSLANVMKSCTSYTTKGDKAQFDFILRIKPDGGVSETLLRPRNALTTCVDGLVQGSHHPPHKFESVLIYINMSVKE
jgi:hypothetical protein